MSPPRKRSLTLRGHRTSVSLEPEFWRAFRRLCDQAGASPGETLAAIDGNRDGNLSSAVRLWVLARLDTNPA